MYTCVVSRANTVLFDAAEDSLVVRIEEPALTSMLTLSLPSAAGRSIICAFADPEKMV